MVKPHGQLNVCRAGIYGGQVTDGMCRMCVERGDRPEKIINLPRVDVGELAESTLKSLGITEDRVKQWLHIKDCGCKKRAKWLTRWGYEQQENIELLLNKAARWYGIT